MVIWFGVESHPVQADNSDAYDPNADDALEPDSLGLVEAPAELQSRLLDQQQIQAGFERAARDPYTVARISLKIYYTRRFRAITPDMKASVGVGGGGVGLVHMRVMLIPTKYWYR